MDARPIIIRLLTAGINLIATLACSARIAGVRSVREANCIPSPAHLRILVQERGVGRGVLFAQALFVPAAYLIAPGARLV